MSPAPYTRIHRSWKTGISGAALEVWAAADHILVVTRQGFVELYRRFYLGDVQAFVIQSTREGATLTRILAWLAFLAAALFGLGAMLRWPVGLALVFFLLAAGLTLALVIHLSLGPTCRCRILTAVQTFTLHGLGRLPASLRLRDRIVRRISSVQGGLPSETLADAAGELDAAARAAVPSVTAILPGQPVPAPMERPNRPAARALKHVRGRAHELLFITLLVDAAHTAASSFFQNSFLTFISGLLFIALLASITVSLILQSGTDLPSRVRTFTWTTLGYFVLFVALSAGHAFLAEIRNPGFFLPSPARPRPVFTSPFEMALHLGSFAFSAYVGLVGLLDLRLFRRLSTIPPATPPAPAPLDPPPAASPAIESPPPEPAVLAPSDSPPAPAPGDAAEHLEGPGIP